MRGYIIIFMGLALVSGILAIMPGGSELQVTPVKSNEPLIAILLNPHERFTLHYYHSVENAPIWETHSIDSDGRIYIEEERYLKFGAGMGKMPGVGRMEKQGDYEVITDMHSPTGDFILRIGSPGVNHTLLWRGNRINLSETAPHVAVRFSAKSVSQFYKCWRKLFPHPEILTNKGCQFKR